MKLAAAAVVPTTLTATSCLQQQETKTLERGEDVAIRTGTGHNNQKIKELGERVTALEASWKSRWVPLPSGKYIKSCAALILVIVPVKRKASIFSMPWIVTKSWNLCLCGIQCYCWWQVLLWERSLPRNYEKTTKWRLYRTSSLLILYLPYL